MTEDAITLSVDQSNFDHSASGRPMRKRLFPVLIPLKRILLTVFLVGYVVAVSLNRKYDTGDYNWIAFIVFGGLILYLILIILQRQKIWQSVADTPSRSGIQTVTLDGEKMSVDHPGFHAEIHWSHVLDVIDGKDGLLILIGALEAQPIPANAIPKLMTQAELKDQISRWITLAKTQP